MQKKRIEELNNYYNDYKNGELSKDGNYIKLLDNSNNTAIGFGAKYGDSCDKYYALLTSARINMSSNINGYQVLDDRQLSFYNNKDEINFLMEAKKEITLYYSYFNIYGKIIDTLILNFNFEDNTLTLKKENKDKIFKIEESEDYTYKILKSKIKAIQGVKGLFKFIYKSMHVDSPFNGTLFNALIKTL